MKSQFVCLSWVNGSLYQNNFTTDKLFRAFSSCFKEIIFTESKKDRHRERLGNCQYCSCFSTSSPSQSLCPASSHPSSSGVCISQSTPSALCVEPGFLRNEYKSQRIDCHAQSAFLFCWAPGSPLFPASPVGRNGHVTDYGNKWRAQVPCKAHKDLPDVVIVNIHWKMEPVCEGYCSDNSQSRISVSALWWKVGVEGLNARVDGWAFVWVKILSQTFLLPELLL